MWPALESVCHLNQNLATGLRHKRHKELWPPLVPDHVTDGWTTNYLDLNAIDSIWNSRKYKKTCQTYFHFNSNKIRAAWWFLIMWWMGGRLPGFCGHRSAHNWKVAILNPRKTHDDKQTQWNNHSPPWRFLIIWWLVDRTSQQTFLNNNACCHKHNRGCHISYWKYNSTELSMRNKCNFTTQASSFQPP